MKSRTEPDYRKILQGIEPRNALTGKGNGNQFCLFSSLCNLAILATRMFDQVRGRLLRSICCRKQLDIPLLAILICVSLSACSRSVVERIPAPTGSSETKATERADTSQVQSVQNDDQVIQAQANQAHKVEVLFCAKVKKLLPDDTKGLPHQRFLLELSNGSSLLIAHDTKYAPVVPIQAGDLVTVKGEYIWNKRGGVVHWTHRSDTPRHEGGYIDFQGVRYQ